MASHGQPIPRISFSKLQAWPLLEKLVATPQRFVETSHSQAAAPFLSPATRQRGNEFESNRRLWGIYGNFLGFGMVLGFDRMSRMQLISGFVRSFMSALRVVCVLVFFDVLESFSTLSPWDKTLQSQRGEQGPQDTFHVHPIKPPHSSTEILLVLAAVQQQQE